MYKLVNEPKTNMLIGVRITTSTGEIFIPINPDLPEYQEYLDWVAQGNTPLPAEENQ